MRRSVISYTIGEREDGIVLGQFSKAKGFSHRLTVRIKAAHGLAAVSYTHLASEIMVEGWVEEASYIAMFLIPLSASLQARILAAFSVFP